MAPDFTLVAKYTEPMTGVNINSAPLSDGSRAILDGSSTRTNLSGNITRDPNAQVSTLRIPYTNVSEGRHTIALRLTNMAGFEVEKLVNFTVSTLDATASVLAESLPFRGPSRFLLNHALGDDVEVTIYIEDAAGHTVRRLEGTTEWDLLDNAGKPVADGLYTAHALVRSGLRRTNAEPFEFVVLRAAAQ